MPSLSPSLRTRLFGAAVRWGLLVGCGCLLVMARLGADGLTTRGDRGFAYTHDVDSKVPWSIHIFRMDRGRPDLVLASALGNGQRLGMNVLEDQVRLMSPALGKPLAAINGDFYIDEPALSGDPRDLQIHEGELISAPHGNACFWVDALGNPHSTNVVSRLRVHWSDGRETPMGLNQLRESETTVLYTPAVGSNTPVQPGAELILESAGGSWLPLRPGQTLRARVRAHRSQGGTPVEASTLVLAVSPQLAAQAPVGTEVQILTETIPDLTGATTAIGGGPTLVRDGKPREWSGFLLRHPRSAVGWNKDHVFLVEVDGRQAGLSVGMTFPEFANYLVQLGCDQAMNLDGGGSAALWVFGQLMSNPSEGQERPGANSLVVLQRKASAEQASQ